MMRGNGRQRERREKRFDTQYVNLFLDRDLKESVFRASVGLGCLSGSTFVRLKQRFTDGA